MRNKNYYKFIVYEKIITIYIIHMDGGATK